MNIMIAVCVSDKNNTLIYRFIIEPSFLTAFVYSLTGSDYDSTLQLLGVYRYDTPIYR